MFFQLWEELMKFGSIVCCIFSCILMTCLCMPVSAASPVRGSLDRSSTVMDQVHPQTVPVRAGPGMSTAPADLFTLAEIVPAEKLTSTAQQAVAWAPDWLRDDLTDNFAAMDIAFQDIYADMILNPTDIRFTDEIAFCVAQIGVTNLQDLDFIPDLLEENAFYIYEHDQYLDYVRIVDVGTPGVDDNYYTTTFYMVDEAGTPTEYELDMEKYYWFIVHPKIEDEWAYYIDPAAEGDIPAAPPTGVFWRDWMFTHTEPITGTDEDYPILRDQFTGVNVLWAGGNDGAIGTLHQWIAATLSFTSGAERPHQPVRIYTLHVGRCGEYQDYTTAISRACLIPCINTEAISEDHVWNEFWDRRWVHWEPVNGYVDIPLTYEDGWGKVFSGVVNVRGDGYAWDVIDRYSSGSCVVNVNVLDADGYPVDGAQVLLKNAGYPGTWNFTNCTGGTSLIFGDSLPLKGKINWLGNKYPDGAAWFDIHAETVDGETYTWDVTLPYNLPQFNTVPAQDTGSTGYRFNIDYALNDEIMTGYYQFDKANIFTRRVSGGSIDMFITDQPNYDAYLAGESFTNHAMQSFSSDGNFTFDIPQSGTWNVVFSTERKLNCRQILNATIVLEEDQDGSWVPVDTVTRDIILFPGDRYVVTAGVVAELGTKLWMPSDVFHAGDPCACNVTVANPGPETYTDVPLFVILDVYGTYFFWPDFSDFNYQNLETLAPGINEYVVLPEFPWPEVSGNVSGILWYAAMTNAGITELFGTLDMWEFGWGE